MSLQSRLAAVIAAIGVDIKDLQDNAPVDGLTPDLMGASTTSTLIATGSKTFDLSPAMNVPFQVGQFVRAVGVSPLNFMNGVVTASSTTQVTIQVLNTSGSGTFADWDLGIGAYEGMTQNAIVILVRGGATALNIGNLTGAVALNTAHNAITLVSANMLNAAVKCTFTGNVTFSTATMPAVGTAPLRFRMIITQDATGSRTLTLTGFKRANPLQSGATAVVLSTAASAIDILEFYWDGTNWYVTLIGKGYA